MSGRDHQLASSGENALRHRGYGYGQVIPAAPRPGGDVATQNGITRCRFAVSPIQGLSGLPQRRGLAGAGVRLPC